MKNAYELAFEFWNESMNQLKREPEFGFFNSFNFPLESYKWYLRETYFHTRENPISQLIATRSFDRNLHSLLGMFVAHAKSEITHDQLALNDFLVLGGDRKLIDHGRPLPDTDAMIGYTYYAAYQDSPIKYLGYLFHVEALPSQQGPDYINLLLKMGIPKSAVTFLEEHAQVDPAHAKLMRTYLEQMIKTNEQQQDLHLGIETGMLLHSRMIAGAIKKGQNQS